VPIEPLEANISGGIIGVVGGAVSGGIVQVKDTCAVGAQLDSIPANLEAVNAAVEKLSAQLAPVLTPVDPATTEGQLKEVTPSESPLAESLRGHNDGLKDVAHKLEVLRGRLEI
jgi:hypothetical protein